MSKNREIHTYIETVITRKRSNSFTEKIYTGSSSSAFIHPFTIFSRDIASSFSTRGRGWGGAGAKWFMLTTGGDWGKTGRRGVLPAGAVFTCMAAASAAAVGA